MSAEEAGDGSEAIGEGDVKHQVHETGNKVPNKMAKFKVSETVLDSESEMGSNIQPMGDVPNCKQMNQENGHLSTELACCASEEHTREQSHKEGLDASRSKLAFSLVQNYISELEKVASNIETILKSQSTTTIGDSQHGHNIQLSATAKCTSFIGRSSILGNILSKIPFLSSKDFDFRFPTFKLKSRITKAKTTPKKSLKNIDIFNGKKDAVNITERCHTFFEEIRTERKMEQNKKDFEKYTLEDIQKSLQSSTKPELSSTSPNEIQADSSLSILHGTMNICDISDEHDSIDMNPLVDIKSKHVLMITSSPVTSLACSREKYTEIYHENIFNVPTQNFSKVIPESHYEIENSCTININNNGNTTSTPRNFTMSSFTSSSGSNVITNECLNLKRKTQNLKHSMAVSGNDVLIFNGSKVYSISQRAMKKNEILGRVVCDMDKVKEENLETSGGSDTIQNDFMVRRRELASSMPKTRDFLTPDSVKPGQLPNWTQIDQTKDSIRPIPVEKRLPIKYALTEDAKQIKCLDIARNETNPPLRITQSEASMLDSAEPNCCLNVAQYKPISGLNVTHSKSNAFSELFQPRPCASSSTCSKSCTNQIIATNKEPQFLFINNQIRTNRPKLNLESFELPFEASKEKTKAINKNGCQQSMNTELTKKQENTNKTINTKKSTNVVSSVRKYKQWEERRKNDPAMLIPKPSSSAMVTKVNNSTIRAVGDEQSLVSHRKITNSTGKISESRNNSDANRWAGAIGNETTTRFSNIKKIPHPNKKDFPVRIRSVLKSNESEMNDFPAQTRRLTVESPAENLIVQTAYVRPNPAITEEGINIEMTKCRSGVYLGDEDEYFSTVGTRRLICEAECVSSKDPTTKSLVVENGTPSICNRDVSEEFSELIGRAQDGLMAIEARKMICAGNELTEFGGSDVSEKWIGSNRIKMIGNYLVIGSAQSSRSVIKMIQKKDILSITSGNEDTGNIIPDVSLEAGDIGDTDEKKIDACDHHRYHGCGDQMALATHFEEGNNNSNNNNGIYL